MEFGLHYWVGFLAFVVAIILYDLIKLHRGSNELSLRSASIMTGIWVLIALLFGIIIYFSHGRVKALEFITGYIVELTLSVDNIFVFLIIFIYFKIPKQYQYRVLFWGIIGAIVMRFAMIIGGIYILKKFEWIFYLFGAFLIISAVKISVMDLNGNFKSNSDGVVTKILKRFNRITAKFHGDKFFVFEKGRLKITPLFIALVAVEKTDLIFAMDSIPAILAITQDKFIVFASNILAILGLRSLYFLIENLILSFKYLKYGIALILMFIGIKMILSLQGVHISVEYSLLIIFSIISTCGIASWYLTKDNYPKKAIAKD